MLSVVAAFLKLDLIEPNSVLFSEGSRDTDANKGEVGRGELSNRSFEPMAGEARAPVRPSL